MPDYGLADKIRSKLAAKLLPTGEPVKTWAGHGRGTLCAGCDEPIRPFQIQYELETADKARFPLHQGCHGLWAAEHRRRRWVDLPSVPSFRPPGARG